MKTQYLKIVLSLVLAINLNAVKAQLTANAGSDTIVCEYDTLQLGEFPSAYGGTPPYTYTWETTYTLGRSTFYASTFLNNTSISNPLIISNLTNLETLTFKLTVTDALLNAAEDSIKITFSQYFDMMVDNFATINQGDSVQLTNTTSGGVPPLTFAWVPNYNLSDYTDQSPWAKPDTTTYYDCIVTDAGGCHSSNGDIYEVYVSPLGIEENINSKFILFPNPSANEINIAYKNEPAKNLIVEIYSSTGKLVLNRKIISFEKTVITTHELPAGIYFISLKDDGGIVATKKWIKTK